MSASVQIFSDASDAARRLKASWAAKSKMVRGKKKDSRFEVDKTPANWLPCFFGFRFVDGEIDGGISEGWKLVDGC